MRTSRVAVISFCLGLFAILLSPLPAFSQDQDSASPEVRAGLYHGRVVTYVLDHGRAIYQGDVILQGVQDVSAQGSFEQGKGAPPIVGVAYPVNLWPSVGGVFQVPYIITNGATNLAAALTSFNNTFPGFIQFVSRTTQSDYVNFDFDSSNTNGQCEVTSVGRAGGEQYIEGSGSCTVATILHEMGHTIGLFHEMIRSDRDTYVDVMYNNIIKGSRLNFDPPPDNTENLTLYDYASIMHYIPFAFSRNGGPAIESIPSGIPLSNSVGYTTTDIDGIKRLYGMIPTDVTIDSNPTGLEVMVDGSPITTPQAFSWTLNSTHTLSVSSAAQTPSGTTYIYGRWNDNASANHTITIAPGNNMPGLPGTSPQVTVYTANFIELVGFNPLIYPANSGSFTENPMPMTVSGASGSFYVVRQPVTFTATPANGYNFYQWYSYMPGAVSSNPKTLYMESMPPSINVTAAFTPGAVTTITNNPPDSDVGIVVDGSDFWYGPKNFSPYYDSTWTAGSSHTVDVASPQSPHSINTQYEFSNWSDGGGQSHSIIVPAGNSVFTANMTPQYVPIDFQTCGGNVTLSPPSPNGFYNSGTQVTFTEAPATGWIFTGWQYDLTGLGNPQTLTVNDEELTQANFNIISTPVSATSLSPPSASAGGPGFTLAVNGTGFATNSLVNINGQYRAGSQFISSTQLTVPITSTDIQTPGAFQVSVENFPLGSMGCAVFAPQTFFVLIPGASTTTKLMSSTNPSSFNQPVTFTATVTSHSSGTPTGTVTFMNGATTLGAVNLNSSAQAMLMTATLPVGSNPITATYSGDSNFSSSMSSALKQKVNKASTTTAVVSSKNPSTFGQKVTFTATVTPLFGGKATGTVTFKDGTNTLGTGHLNATNKTTFSTTTLARGMHSITAVYNGNANFSGSTSPVLTQTVN